MARLSQLISATGVINNRVYDTGLTSTEAEKKHVESIIVSVSGHIGNIIEIWLEREKLFEIPDYCIDTDEVAGAANPFKSVVKKQEIPIDTEIPVGQKMQVAILCGGTAKNLRGCYVYRLV